MRVPLDLMAKRRSQSDDQFTYSQQSNVSVTFSQNKFHSSSFFNMVHVGHKKGRGSGGGTGRR